jgi:hypothetical protein
VVQALGASAQFAGSLRAAQQQHADKRRLRAVEVEDLAQPMLVLVDAAVGGTRAASQMQIFQAMQRLAHLLLIEGHHRLAVGALIAGVDERVEREGIVLRRGHFFFNECAQDAGLRRGKNERSSRVWIGRGHRFPL